MKSLNIKLKPHHGCNILQSEDSVKISNFFLFVKLYREVVT